LEAARRWRPGKGASGCKHSATSLHLEIPRSTNSRSQWSRGRCLRQQQSLKIGIQKSAYLLQNSHRLRRFGVPKVLRQDQIIAALLQRPLRNVKEARLVAFAAPLKPLRDIRRYGHSGPPHLATESEKLMLRKAARQSIYSQSEFMGLLPNQQVLERPSRCPLHRCLVEEARHPLFLEFLDFLNS